MSDYEEDKENARREGMTYREYVTSRAEIYHKHENRPQWVKENFFQEYLYRRRSFPDVQIKIAEAKEQMKKDTDLQC